MASRTGTLTAALLLALGAPLGGQAPALPRLQGVDFVAGRYVASGSASLYAGNPAGAGMMVTGVVRNERTEYRAVVVGGGTRLALGRGAGVTAILAGADATDGRSARLYVMPRLAAGRLVVTATATAFQPLGGRSVRQAAVNPLTVAVRITPRLQAGVAAVLEMKDARPAAAGLGPSVGLRVPGGTLTIEAMVVGRRTRPEVRAAFSAPLPLSGRSTI